MPETINPNARKQDLNRDWAFMPGMYSAESAANARTVQLPHDYLIETDTRPEAMSGPATGYYDAFPANYTKHVVIPAEWKGVEVRDLLYSDDLDIERLNPLLLVKDFGATGPLTTSDEFMTVADVPSLVLDGIVENPVNPFTGNPITTDDKQNPQLVTTSRRNQAYHHPGATYDTSDRHLYTVHDDLFDFDNWQFVE